MDDEFRLAISRIEKKLDYVIAKAEMTVLAGTQYSKFLMPLEYLPSRSYHSRWGNTHPPIPQIARLLEDYADVFRDYLRDMRRLALNLSDIPLNWDQAAQPQPCWAGTPLNSFDSVLVYTMLARHAPPTYLEIGSGMSTLFAHRAKKDFGLSMKIISIDPEPRSEIDLVCDVVVRDSLENVDLDIFWQLQSGDILFFDGSHRSFTNSDVTVFMIDVLPNLAPGVIVHVHDIALPIDYANFALDWYWNEQYLLAVYIIAAGEKIQPLMSASFIGHRPDLFPEHHTSGPMIDLGEWNSWFNGGSFWFTQK